MADVAKVLVLCLMVGLVQGKDVTYYVAAIEQTWDYAPSGRNLINQDQTIAKKYLYEQTGESRHAFQKVIYREYTDSTFRTQKQHPEYLGIVGPVLTANVGDQIVVHFKNNASNSHSIHPTGLTYTKSNEGSSYEDGTTVFDKADNAIRPGETHVYTWNVTSENGPQFSDPDCVTSLYYSDVNGAKDVNSGLIGFIIICKRGKVLRDTDKNIPLFFNVFDENLSLYNQLGEDDENVRQYSINGYSFGNLPQPVVCVNDEVIVHTAGFGRSEDVHVVKVHGQSLTYKGKSGGCYRYRLDSVLVYPGSSTSVSILPTETGQWLVTSLDPKLALRGMQALLSVRDCGTSPTRISASGKIRRYYIAAEEIVNRSNGKAYKGFVQYDGSFFSRKITRPQTDIHGIIGPLITAEVGDVIKVVFLNKDDQPRSIFPHGVRIHKRNEGAFYKDGNDYRPVPPNGFKTYYWTIPEFYGPTAYNNLPCIAQYYTSGVGRFSEVTSGLIGPMLICKQGMLDQSGQPISPKKNIFLFYTDNDINGFAPGNIPSINLGYREKAFLHMMLVGNNDQMTVLTTDGNPFKWDGILKYSFGLTSGYIKSAEIHGIHQGSWKIESSHRKEMKVDVLVEQGDNSVVAPLFRKPNATYYIGIRELNWDYSNGKISRDDWKRKSGSKLGPDYKKVVYRRYDSDVFFWSSGDKFLYGPAIRTVVGHSYNIMVDNYATKSYSLYSPGVLIKRKQGDADRLDVEPENTVSFLWEIPESAGPGPADSDCIVRPYYSNVDKDRDIDSGLIGPLVICRDESAALKDQGSKIITVSVNEETNSWYINHTIHDRITKGDASLSTDMVGDPAFVKTNRIYAINGSAEGTIDDIKYKLQNAVTVHLMNVGPQFHSLHFHGAVITDSEQGLLNGRNTVPLFPETSTSVKLLFHYDGQWRYEGVCTDDRLRKLYGNIIRQIRSQGGGIS